MCVVGSHDLFEHPHINDLAYMPAVKDERFGFNLLVGGFFSPKRCAEAVSLDAWVPADDVIPVCEAILEAYRDLGNRGNRQKTRMMWLIDELVSNHSLYYAMCLILYFFQKRDSTLDFIDNRLLWPMCLIQNYRSHTHTYFLSRNYLV